MVILENPWVSTSTPYRDIELLQTLARISTFYAFHYRNLLSHKFCNFDFKEQKHQDNKKSMLSSSLLSTINFFYSCHYFKSGFNVNLRTEKLLTLGCFQEKPSGVQSIEIRELTDVYRYFKEWCTSYIDQRFVDMKAGRLMAGCRVS